MSLKYFIFYILQGWEANKVPFYNSKCQLEISHTCIEYHLQIKPIISNWSIYTDNNKSLFTKEKLQQYYSLFVLLYSSHNHD